MGVPGPLWVNSFKVDFLKMLGNTPDDIADHPAVRLLVPCTSLEGTAQWNQWQSRLALALDPVPN